MMDTGVTEAGALTPRDLRRRCNPESLGFVTTADLPDIDVILGQQRAVEAIEFGVAIRQQGYNLFALSQTGGGTHAIVRRFLERQAASAAAPVKWCYVHNFDQPYRPKAIALPNGEAATFRADMTRLVADLRTAITTALESDEYRQQHQQIHDEFNRRREKTFDDLRERAAKQGVALLRTPIGLALAPMTNGDVLAADAFERLPDAQKQQLRASMQQFESEVEKVMHDVPRWQRETNDRITALRHAVIKAAVDALIEEVRRTYAGHVAIQNHLTALERDVIEHADDLRHHKQDEENPIVSMLDKARDPESALVRYRINVLGQPRSTPGAPVVYEDRPTFQNLVGRIEYVSQMGTLSTDFTRIKAGALHEANGGYLILDAHRLLTEPFAWDGLKRALRARAIRIESLGEALSLVSTQSLAPEPIPLDVKVVLLGEPRIYYLLYNLDPDFRDLFKVAADFETTIDRTTFTDTEYSRLIAALARKESLKPFGAAAVARVIDESARIAEDAGKLSVQLDVLTDLLREADHCASVSERTSVDAADVQAAVDARERRAGRPRDRLREAVERGVISIATSGATIGQVNGLSVIELGGFAFAQPSRITARIRLGAGKVVDIEREVELGGPIHSKGVLILSGFLSGRYAVNQPLSVSASLVFEQSYAGVEGDSASCAELCALLSALAELPVRQSIAVTGSVNQRGEVQAVGGINEKIEGFFDVCRTRRLTGDQGVIIPRSNVRHLMLRDDVVVAVERGEFHVYAVETIDEAIEIVMGSPASVAHQRVEARLLDFAERARHALGGPER